MTSQEYLYLSAPERRAFGCKRVAADTEKTATERNTVRTTEKGARKGISRDAEFGWHHEALRSRPNTGDESVFLSSFNQKSHNLHIKERFSHG